jgi:hypothetical protein
MVRRRNLRNALELVKQQILTPQPAQMAAGAICSCCCLQRLSRVSLSEGQCVARKWSFTQSACETHLGLALSL